MNVCYWNLSLLQNFKDLLAKKDIIVILIGHWFLHAFSLIALTEWSKPNVDGPLFLLVFFPSFFYIITVRLSDPDNFKWSALLQMTMWQSKVSESVLLISVCIGLYWCIITRANTLLWDCGFHSCSSEPVNALLKVMNVLRGLRFPPTGNVDKVGRWD